MTALSLRSARRLGLERRQRIVDGDDSSLPEGEPWSDSTFWSDLTGWVD